MTNEFDNFLARNVFGTTAAQIRGFADTTTPANTSLSQILDELDTSRSQVRDTIDGAPADPTESNVRQLTDRTRRTHRRGITFAAAMGYLASKVEAHDSDINALAASHPDADAEEAADLARPINNRLDGEGDDVAALLDGDPDSDLSVKDLLLAGFIPLGAADYWPDIKANLTDAEKRQYYKNLLSNGTLPDFTTLTGDEIRAYLEDHPHLAADLPGILAANLSRQEREQVQAIATAQAEGLAEAIENGTATAAELRTATATLEGINERIADNGELTGADADYIETWLDTLGADNIAALPSIAKDVVPHERGPDNHTYQDLGSVRVVADAILNYSNPDVHAPDAGIDTSGGPPHLNPSDGRVSVSEMPQSIQDLMNPELGSLNEYSGPYPNDGWTADGIDPHNKPNFDVSGLERWAGFADLLSSASADVEGGTQFSYELADDAIDVKQDLNAIAANADAYVVGIHEGTVMDTQIPDWISDLRAATSDDSVSDMLSVAARNEDGAAKVLLNDDNRNALLGMNWSDDRGAIDIIDSGTDRDDSDGRGGGPLQTRAALEVVQEVGENRAAYLGGYYDSNGDGKITNDDDQAAARMTEGVSDAVVDMGIRWIDQFGQQTDTDPGSNSSNSDGFTMDIATQNDYLQFISGTGDPDDNSAANDAVRFHTAATIDAQNDVTAALNGDPDSDLDAALRRAGRLEGAISGADYQYLLERAGGEDADEHAKKEAAFKAEERAWNAGKLAANLVVAGASTATGPAAPVTTGLLSTGINGVVGLMGPGDPPDYSTIHQGQTAEQVMQQMQSNAPIMEQTTVGNAALQAGIIDEMPGVEVGPNGTPQISEDATPQEVEDVYDAVKNELLNTPNELDEGTYRGGWETHFNSRNSLPSQGGDWTTDDVYDYLYGDNIPDAVRDGNVDMRYPSDPDKIYVDEPFGRMPK